MDFTQLPSILTPDLGLLFWMLLAFLVVFGVLAKFGFPAIINMVDERNKYIDESLRKAHEAQERLANIEKREAGSDIEGGCSYTRCDGRKSPGKG